MAYNLFVYGTLRRDYPGGMADMLDKGAEFIGTRTIQGDLFYLGGFPGVLPGEGTVHGDLFRVTSDALLARMDSYEGHPSLFERRQVTIHGGSEEETGWVYFYNQPIRGNRPIIDGDFLRFIGDMKSSIVSSGQ